MPADSAGVAGCVSATVTAICDAWRCERKRVMVMKPVVRVFGVELVSLSTDSKSGEVHGLVESRYIERKDDQRERKKFQREMEERNERCARAHRSAGRFICERRHKGKSAREMSAIGSIKAWREQRRRDPAKGIRGDGGRKRTGWDA